MEPNWAASHLQVIRTLMERSAIYRRALAPVTLFLGLLGLAASVAGFGMGLESNAAFGWFWMGVGVVGASGAFFMVRRQALHESDCFWSPPTRRVTQAFLPPLFAGMVIGVLFATSASTPPLNLHWLPAIWMILYGCAVHAAGFFMPRGMKLFGWGFIVAACALASICAVGNSWAPPLAHIVMGVSFGGFHLAYGIYLYFTEKRAVGSES
jgi:hypothetical protein